MIEIIPFYAENRPKIEVVTSDISGAITALAAAQESERFRNEAEVFRNEAEGFSELTNSDRIQTGIDRIASEKQREAIVEVDSCGEEDKFDVYATFNGPGIRATTNAAAAPGVYRVKTAPLQVPATTTTIQFQLEIWTGTTKASGGKVRFGKCVLLRVAAPPTF